MKMICLLQVLRASSAKKPGNTQENIQPRQSLAHPSPRPGNAEAGDRDPDGISLFTPALLERDEAGGVGGADAGPAVLHRFVGDGELAQVVADHLGLQGERSVLGTEPGGHRDNPCHPHLHPRLAGAWHSWVIPARLPLSSWDR